MRETAKNEDGFPVQRLHFHDTEGDKLLAKLDVEIPAANLQTEGLSYVLLTP